MSPISEFQPERAITSFTLVVPKPLHIYKNHDLTEIVYLGCGKYRLGSEAIPLTQGNVEFRPARVPHAFQNTAAWPTVAIAVVAPAFDGNDIIVFGRRRRTK